MGHGYHVEAVVINDSMILVLVCNKMGTSFAAHFLPDSTAYAEWWAPLCGVARRCRVRAINRHNFGLRSHLTASAHL